MPIDLAAMMRRIRNPRRKLIVLPDIAPPDALATDLYVAAYKPIIELWTRALPGIIAEYERTLGPLIKDSPSDLQQRLDAAQSDYERLVIILTAGLNDWAVRTERWHRGKWRAAVLRATGVDLQLLLGPEGAKQTLEQIIQWNVSLIGDVQAQAKQKIANAVFAGLHARSPARDVAAEIGGIVELSRQRALRIASDQLAKLNSALSAERRREAGMSIYRYRHSGKLHPRSWHRARNGKLFAENPADAGRTINGEVVNEPIAADDRAGIPPFCGCREQAVLDFSAVD